MKLLVDEMYSPIVARRLRDECDADVVSVLDRPDLRGRSDDVVFEAAQREGRMIVTENVPDYLLLARDDVAAGRTHHGLALTTNRRFPRAKANTISRLVRRLEELLEEPEPVTGPSNREVWL